MNCSLHNDVSATNTCEICGNGICNDCMSMTENLGKMCVPCAMNWLTETYEATHKYYKWLIMKVILLSIGWAIGLTLLLCFFLVPVEDNPTANWILLSLGLLLSGLPTAISAWRKTKEAFDSYEDNRGKSYTKYGNAAYRNEHWTWKLIMSILGLMFGVIFTPIQAIVAGVNIKKTKEFFPIAEEQYACLSEYYESVCANVATTEEN